MDQPVATSFKNPKDFHGQNLQEKPGVFRLTRVRPAGDPRCARSVSGLSQARFFLLTRRPEVGLCGPFHVVPADRAIRIFRTVDRSGSGHFAACLVIKRL